MALLEYPVLLLPDEFSECNKSIHALTEHVLELNASIIKLNESHVGLIAPTHANNIYNHSRQHYISELSDNTFLIRNESKEQTKRSSLTDSVNTYIETAKSFGNVAESGIKLYEEFKELPPVFEKIKNGVKIFNGALKTFEGMEGLAEATGVAEIAAAGSSIMAGMESMVAGSALLGPVGWVVGGSLLIGGITAVALSRTNNEPSTFADEAKKSGNPYLLDTERQSKNADEYIKIAKEHKDRIRIPAETEQMKQAFLHQSSIEFNFRKAEANDPVYLNALVSALIENDRSEKKPIKQVAFGNEDDLAAFRKKFDPYHHFPLKTMPRVKQIWHLYEPGDGEIPSRYRDIEYTISRKDYDIQQGKYPRNKTPEEIVGYNNLLKTTTANYLTHDFNYVQKEYEHSLKRFESAPIVIDQIKKFWGEFLQVKEVIDQDRNQKPERNKVSHRFGEVEKNGITTGGRVININLNKSMIEHFTINAKEVKEGLNDFKHKVEEVLLEILNSANAIQ